MRVALVALILSAGLIAPARRLRFVSAAGAARLARHAPDISPEDQARLVSAFGSHESARFNAALDELFALGDGGSLALWRIALDNATPRLKKRVWQFYRQVWPALSRREMVPQIVRFRQRGADGRDYVAAMSAKAGARVYIFGDDNGIVASVPPSDTGSLKAQGLDFESAFDSVAAMAIAARSGDPEALRLWKAYQSTLDQKPGQFRIGVVDLSKTAAPAPGFSSYAGDAEDIIARNDRYAAYLDLFESDGSAASISNHIRDRYTGHGLALAGLFTPAEFSSVIERYFPGKNFDPGLAPSGSRSAKIEPELENGAFHSAQSALDECKALALSYPDLAQVVNLGNSYEGREIFALKISANVSIDDPSKPDVLITGCHHAREWISVEPPMYFANQLLSQYATDTAIRYLVDNLTVWIVPVVNPDGLTYSQGSPNDQLDNVRLWRKNRRPVSEPGCNPGVGVDLNRNYQFEWRLPGDLPCPNYTDDVGASDDATSDIYRGPSPGSEPEIQDLEILTNDPNHHFVARIDYHNYSQLILYPWGYQQPPDSDGATQSALASRMQVLGAASSGVNYTPETGFDFYITTGSATDYSYAVNQVPAPILVELRPDCCNFNVPESDILPIDQESWAGARLLMQWAAGPPILQSVQAYQQDQTGSFVTLVYSSEWIRVPGGRQQAVDVRYPVLQPGPIKVKLVFSKPMDTASTVTASMGRSAPYSEVTLASSGSGEGWQTSTYANDTWIGEGVIPSGGDTSSPWRISADAKDAVPLDLDANPATVASYKTGQGWTGYEGAGGGNQGGADSTSILGPSLNPALLSVTVGSPSGGERYIGGQSIPVSWAVSGGGSFQPASESILLSTDSGVSYTQVASGIPGANTTFPIVLPTDPTAEGRIRVLVQDARTGNTTYGDEPGNFTIGANVGSALAVTANSSQVVSQSWSDTASGASGSSELLIDLTVTNTGSLPVINPFVVVSVMTRNVLLSRDLNSPPGVGAIASIPTGSTNNLAPGQSASLTLRVGLANRKKFEIDVLGFGVPAGGQIPGSGAFLVWHGKPRG